MSGSLEKEQSVHTFKNLQLRMHGSTKIKTFEL